MSWGSVARLISYAPPSQAGARLGLVTTLAIALAACSSNNQTTTGPAAGSVSGAISSPQRGPLGGVTVTASPGGRSTASSNLTGAYTIDNLSSGTYSLALSMFPSGCADPGSKQATVTAGGSATVNFTVPCQRLYVANSYVQEGIAGGTITVYGAGSPVDATPVATLAGAATALNAPVGVAVDASGIYVANGGDNILRAYPAGATGNAQVRWAVFVTGLAMGAVSGGQVYVGSGSGNSIEVFSTTDGKLLNVIQGGQTQLATPLAVAVDPGGKVYVTNQNNTITVYAAGATADVAPIAVIGGMGSGLAYPAAIALDTTGRIYVANHDNNSITVYAAGATSATPVATISGAQTQLSFPVGIAVDLTGRIFVSNFNSESITIYASGATGNAAPVASISGGASGIASPKGIAIGP